MYVCVWDQRFGTVVKLVQWHKYEYRSGWHHALNLFCYEIPSGPIENRSQVRGASEKLVTFGSFFNVGMCFMEPGSNLPCWFGLPNNITKTWHLSLPSVLSSGNYCTHTVLSIGGSSQYFPVLTGYFILVCVKIRESTTLCSKVLQVLALILSLQYTQQRLYGLFFCMYVCFSQSLKRSLEQARVEVSQEDDKALRA